MEINQIKKRLEIINEKIERIQDLKGFIEIAEDLEYYEMFGSKAEKERDIKSYNTEIIHLENSIHEEIELLNQLK